MDHPSGKISLSLTFSLNTNSKFYTSLWHVWLRAPPILRFFDFGFDFWFVLPSMPVALSEEGFSIDSWAFPSAIVTMSQSRIATFFSSCTPRLCRCRLFPHRLSCSYTYRQTIHSGRGSYTESFLILCSEESNTTVVSSSDHTFLKLFQAIHSLGGWGLSDTV